MSRNETAPYEVLKKEGSFEIRKYDTFFTVTAKESEIGETMGFNQLFSYISGENATHETIAMTVPVLNDLSEDHRTTEFVMPERFTKEGPLSPLNPGLGVHKYEKCLMASISFSGSIDAERIRSHKNQLVEWLATTEWEPTGRFLLARYNSPFSLPVFRTNEVLAVLKR